MVEMASRLGRVERDRVCRSGNLRKKRTPVYGEPRDLSAFVAEDLDEDSARAGAEETLTVQGHLTHRATADR